MREAKTLMQAVFLAGGFTRDANRKMIIRARPDGRGDWQIQSANVRRILNQKGDAKDLTLEDGDYIFIPESRILQLNKAVENFRGLLLSDTERKILSFFLPASFYPKAVFFSFVILGGAAIFRKKRSLKQTLLFIPSKLLIFIDVLAGLPKISLKNSSFYSSDVIEHKLKVK